jgi:glyoxylase-like metal-dependent hydrolase (beta-lactamase superfamily II)
LTAALRAQGVSLSDIALVVVTHGHADHAGLASAIARRSHARIAIGAGDLPMARRGEDDELHPTSFFAALIRPVIPDHYHPFTPDIVVADRVDLHEYGIAGHLEPMPGHTPGSIVLVLDNGTAFVGDQMLGGFFGGLIAPELPGEHYFQADRQRNLGNIAQLLSRGVRVFYLGHGGPVRAADVARAFELPPPGR